MGNEQTKKQSDVQIELNHSKITSIHVINTSKKRYIQAIFGVQANDYVEWVRKLDGTKLNSNYLLLPFEHEFSSKALCGTTGSSTVKYDNYPYLLIEEIQNRRAKKKRFDQTELWLLLYCLLEAQKQMRNANSSKVGDIRPNNIFLNQQGSIKVANLLSWPRETTNYQKFLQLQQTYLSPEDMKLIQQSLLDNQSNKLSEIFSIGLTLLSAASLTDLKFLYTPKSANFNNDQFGRVLNQFRVNQYYSDIFKSTLCSLVEINQQQRCSQLEMQPWLQKYKNQILARSDFVINDPPQKVIAQVLIIRSLYEQIGNSSYTQGYSSIFNSEQKRIVGVPLQGSRRLVEQKRLPPISMIPGTSTAQSIYTPIEKPSYLSKFLIQGAPIESNNLTYINRISVPNVQNINLGESVYQKRWESQGESFIPRTNFQYSSSPQRRPQEFDKNIQQSPQRLRKQQSNQPQILEDKPQQFQSKKQ